MLLNKDNSFWQDKGAIFTATEINQQPETWKKTIEIVDSKKEEVKKFLDSFFSNNDHEIILTGAGTSEFTGNSVLPFLNTLLKYKVKSYGTTDIVASPSNYLNKERATLLISFARSGNSPESVAAVEIAQKYIKNVFHLFITCNKEGALSKYAETHDNCFVINLPEETNDKGFAMTSSFSSMYLACVKVFTDYCGINTDAVFEDVINNVRLFLNEKTSYIEDVVNSFAYNRLMVLGSGCLKGLAQESTLKSNELSNGSLMTTFDSSLGVRHGPKAVIKEDSLVIVFVSDDAYTKQYDMDIIKEIKQDNKGKLFVVSSKYDPSLEEISNYYLHFENKNLYESVYLGLEYIVIAQLFALFKSVSLGITTDDPCPTGEVNRVVKGVTIHEYKGE